MRFSCCSKERCCAWLSSHSVSVQSRCLSVSQSVAEQTFSLYRVDAGIEVNGQHCRDVVLSRDLLPTLSYRPTRITFTFQQDVATAHRIARLSNSLESWRYTDFAYSNWLWPRKKKRPTNSPDLNTVDYKIWDRDQGYQPRTRVLRRNYITWMINQSINQPFVTIIVKPLGRTTFKKQAAMLNSPKNVKILQTVMQYSTLSNFIDKALGLCYMPVCGVTTILPDWGKYKCIPILILWSGTIKTTFAHTLHRRRANQKSLPLFVRGLRCVGVLTCMLRTNRRDMFALPLPYSL